MFPFNVHSVDMGTWVSPPCPKITALVIKEVKARQESWYAYWVEVISAQHAIVHVQNMACSVYGGIGSLNFSFHVTGKELLRDLIDGEARDRAYLEMMQERKAAEDRIVAAKKAHILRSIYGE